MYVCEYKDVCRNDSFVKEYIPLFRKSYWSFGGYKDLQNVLLLFLYFCSNLFCFTFSFGLMFQLFVHLFILP